MRKKIVLFFICWLQTTLTAWSQVAVESQIDSIAILIGQQAHLTVTVTAKSGTHIQFPSFKPSEPITPGVEVLETSKADTLQLEGEQIKVSKVFTLTSFDERLYAIPGMKIKADGKTYTGNQLALKVITVDVDTLHPNQFFPPKDVQDNPFKWSEWSGIFWLSVLMVLLCVVGFYLFVRLRANKPIITKIRIIKKVLPHQKAMQAFERIKAEKMQNSDDQKTYYTELTDTLRQYIEERFGFRAMEMTSAEIIDHLQQSGDKRMIDELRELFRTADLVKFAKYSTLMNENDLNLVNAVNFIDKTKIEGQPTEERIVPKLSEQDRRTRKNRATIKAFIYGIGIAVAALLVYIIYNVILLTT